MSCRTEWQRINDDGSERLDTAVMESKYLRSVVTPCAPSWWHEVVQTEHAVVGGHPGPRVGIVREEARAVNRGTSIP